MNEKKTVLFYIFFSCWLFHSIYVPAQSINKPYYKFKTYTINDGLSSNNVKCICKDSKGFLWLGTDRGLQRFNGSSFVTYRHLNNDSNSIINETILSIEEDSQHDIWVSTKNGVARFNYKNGRFTNYEYALKNGSKINIGEAFSFFEDSRNRQWVGARSGLYLFDKAKGQFANYPPSNIPGMKEDHFTRIYSFSETEKNEIVFTVVDGFVIINKQGKQQYMHLPEPTVKPVNHIPCNQVMLLKDYPDEIWVTANLNGFFKYERSLGKWTNYRSGGLLSNDFIIGKPIEWTKNEWLVGADNLCFFNHRTGVFTTAFDKDKIRAISTCYKDEEGNFWIPSGMDGLHLLKLPTQLFSSMQIIPGEHFDKILYYDPVLNAIYGINIYFANGIFKLDLTTGIVTRDSIPSFPPLVSVLNNYIADDDVLYLAMEKGFWKFNLRNHRLDSITLKDDYSSSQDAFFFNLCKSGNKIYLTGKFGKGGPFVYDKLTGSITDLGLAFNKEKNANPYSYYPTYSPGLANPHAQVNVKDLNQMHPKGYETNTYSFCIAIKDHVLYSCMNLADSIYTYNEMTGAKKNIAIPVGYTNGKPCSILNLCVDKKQNLWCGTADNGIFVLNIPSSKWIKHIGQEEGYFASLSSDLLCDEEGMVWCNSSEGLFLFNPDSFHFKNYNLNDGLLRESNGGSLCLLPGHRLACNNIENYKLTYGIINTKPEDTTIYYIPVSISNLKVSGNTFLADTLLDNVEKVTLTSNQNAFSLSYAGVTLTHGENLLYSYFLDGAEKQWHDVGNEQNLSYLNLSPGNYVLHIKCKSRDEKIIGIERLLYITILHAWYQTWWFKLLNVLAISLLLFFAFRYYFQQKIKKQKAIIEKERALNEERSRIAADMHDDVGAGLSRIRYITSAIKDGKNISADDMDKIMSLSDESVEKMNEIVWSLNQGNRDLDELIYYIRSQCAAMVSNANLEFICELPATIPQVNIGWNESRNMYMLAKEAVNNAVKHAAATIITLDFSFQNDFIITVADNGKGYNATSANKDGNGLKNYEKRTAALNGTFSITASDKIGTKVMFSLKLTP